MPDLSDVVSRLAKDIKDIDPPVDLPSTVARYAIVQSVQSDSITIRFAGSTVDIVNVKTLGAVIAGSTVFCLQYGNDIIALGATDGIGSATVKLHETLLTTDTASLNITSIPQNYRHLELNCTGRGAGAAAAVSLRFQFNSDSTAGRYDWQSSQQTSTTIGGVRAVNSNQGHIGTLPAASSVDTLNVGSHTLRIPHYAGTAFRRRSYGYGGFDLGDGPTTENTTTSYDQTAAITSLLVFCDVGNMKAGSLITLYGIR